MKKVSMSIRRITDYHTYSQRHNTATINERVDTIRLIEVLIRQDCLSHSDGVVADQPCKLVGDDGSLGVRHTGCGRCRWCGPCRCRRIGGFAPAPGGGRGEGPAGTGGRVWGCEGGGGGEGEGEEGEEGGGCGWHGGGVVEVARCGEVRVVRSTRMIVANGKQRRRGPIERVK